ncbi:hypothetical protein PtB15_6B824 [Puccinia triticina]|nr:hypothetical protein PtB15_6B824 [Puccinia triticina]
MDNDVDRIPGPELCPETVPEDVLVRPARVAPVHINYRLFVQVSCPPVAAGQWGGNPKWRKITPDSNNDAPWMVDVQVITWNFCQSEVINLIVEGKPFMVNYLVSANKNTQLSWYGKVANDGKYGSRMGCRIEGHLAYLDFATQAYDPYPGRDEIRVMMEEPLHALHVERILIKHLAPIAVLEGTIVSEGSLDL